MYFVNNFFLVCSKVIQLYIYIYICIYISLLEYNCFTRLCWLLRYQCESAIRTHVLSHFSRVRLCNPMDYSLSDSPWDSSGKNTGVGCHALLQYVHTYPNNFFLKFGSISFREKTMTVSSVTAAAYGRQKAGPPTPTLGHQRQKPRTVFLPYLIGLEESIGSSNARECP